MPSDGKIQANIARIRDYKRDNLTKMDEARSSTEKKHFRMLARKNQEQIDKYEKRLKENG